MRPPVTIIDGIEMNLEGLHDIDLFHWEQPKPQQ
jgi:hypothetical protein